MQPVAKSFLGIDISADNVKIVEIARCNNNYQLNHYAIELLPPGAILENSIHNTPTVLFALQQALAKNHFSCKQAVIAIPDCLAFSKIIQVDASLSERAIELQIQTDIERYIPEISREIVFDFQIMGSAKNDPSMVDVLLVATSQKSIDTRLILVKSCGLEIKVFTVESDGIERMKLLTNEVILAKHINSQTWLQDSAALTLSCGLALRGFI